MDPRQFPPAATTPCSGRGWARIVGPVCAGILCFGGFLVLAVLGASISSANAASDDSNGPTATPTSATPSASPVDAPDTPIPAEDDSREQWEIALASALGGAALTLLGERIWTGHQDRRSLRSLLSYLSVEVERTRREADERSRRTATAAFPFDPPLGDSAWGVVCSSAVSWRLARKRDLFRDLLAFYDAVDSANHRASVAQQIFNLTQMADLDDDVARLYHAKAMNLVAQPFAEVASSGAAALGRLRAEVGEA